MQKASGTDTPVSSASGTVVPRSTVHLTAAVVVCPQSDRSSHNGCHHDDCQVHSLMSYHPIICQLVHLARRVMLLARVMPVGTGLPAFPGAADQSPLTLSSPRPPLPPASFITRNPLAPSGCYNSGQGNIGCGNSGETNCCTPRLHNDWMKSSPAQTGNFRQKFCLQHST